MKILNANKIRNKKWEIIVNIKEYFYLDDKNWFLLPKFCKKQTKTLSNSDYCHLIIKSSFLEYGIELKKVRYKGFIEIINLLLILLKLLVLIVQLWLTEVLLNLLVNLIVKIYSV